MVPTTDSAADHQRVSDGQRRTRQYTPGFSDGLGDRLLTFHYGTAASLELLRFKQEFSDSAPFEAALRTRIDQLASLHHPSIAVVRTIERIDAAKRLALVSNHISGRRLSELLDKARGAVFATELIQQLTPALAALHNAGAAHGALTAERIVVTRSGLVIVEHVLASAIESLALPASRLRTELGLAVPDGDEPVQFDFQSDLAQLGFVALSLLLGRRLDPTGGPAASAALLEELTRMDVEGASSSSRLRRWIERALQLGDEPFMSAQDAQNALHDLTSNGTRVSSEAHRTILAFHAPSTDPVVTTPEPAAPVVDKPVETAGGRDMSVSAVKTDSPAFAAPASRTTAAPVAAMPAVAPALKTKRPKRRFNTTQLVAVGFGVISIVEGAAIAALLYRRPVPLVLEARSLHDAAALPSAPPVLPPPDLKTELPNSAVTHADAAVVAPPKPETAAPAKTEPLAAAPAPLGGRFGGIKLTSPIELQVFEGGVLLGSTGSPIAIADGTHQLDLVNEALGYRTRQAAAVRAGQLTSLAIAIPNGRVSINAAPWADVWVDGVAAGQTPLANLSLPIGQHEVIFRHPQLGEQRQTAIVKVEGLTRVSVNLQK